MRAKVISKSQTTFVAVSSNDTIAALSTPQGTGAIGIIRITGGRALEVAAEHLGNVVLSAGSNSAFFSKFNKDGKVLDEVVTTVFHEPRTYTGEDLVEISFHGSAFILQQALEGLIKSGARLAAPGEFTKRAFLNGKLDLSQAEAVADLIASESEAEHRLAMHQMRGGFSGEIAKLREELIHFASLIELELDFAEEDVEFANRAQLEALVGKILDYINRLISSFRYGNAIKQGVPVAIIGKPNAGKSTLLNQLLNDDRAIVSDIAGTTRDSIEDIAVIDGIRFRFIDTAGIRKTEDAIEAMGVKRSIEKMRGAAIVLYLFDLNEDLESHVAELSQLMEATAMPASRVISVGNKADLSLDKVKVVLKEGVDGITISAKTGDGLEKLKDSLKSKIEGDSSAHGDVVVTNARHLQALEATHQALTQATQALQTGLSGDLVAADIRQALHHLGSITGEISTDDLLGNIFGKFCIGK